MSRNSYRSYNCFDIYDAFERKGKISRSPGIGSLIVFRHSHIGRVHIPQELRIRSGGTERHSASN